MCAGAHTGVPRTGYVLAVVVAVTPGTCRRILTTSVKQPNLGHTSGHLVPVQDMALAEWQNLQPGWGTSCKHCMAQQSSAESVEY